MQFTLKTAFGDQTTGTCRGRHRAANDTLKVRVGGQGFFEFGVVGVGVVIGFETLGRQFHVREMFFLVFDGTVDPFILGFGGQAADGGGIFALATHGGPEDFHQLRAICLVIKRFEDVVGVFQV